jgi:DNA-binding MarR family transcriptional regulator
MGGVKISNLENVAGDFLAVLAFMRDKFFTTLEQIARPQLSHVQFRAVSLLYRKGSLSMSELAQEMHISKQQLTPLVYKLINNGLLIRKTDENDRRIVRIEITETGRSKVEEILPEIKMALMEKLKTIPKAELDELEQMLKRIHGIIKNIK